MCYYGDWAELCATMAGTVSSKSLVRDSWSDGCARYILGKVFATGSGLHAVDRISNDVFFFFLRLLGGSGRSGSVDETEKTTGHIQG